MNNDTCPNCKEYAHHNVALEEEIKALRTGKFNMTKQILNVIGTMMLVIYITLSIVFFSKGAIDQVENWQCDKPRRWVYILPAYRLGCWLGEPVK